MTRTASLLACLLPFTSLVAQDTLADLEKRFRDEVQQLAATSPSPEQREQQLGRHIQELRAFLGRARGDDRWNGRLMLADLELVRGRRDAATEALRAIDAAEAPGLVLTSGAAMAQHLGLKDLRDRWVTAATEKEDPIGDRMAMARLLMTVLRETEKGEAVFTRALAAAADDEQRAFVRYHRADALRDREDLPENSGFQELEKLSEDLPLTYWGSVAKDRLRATRLNVGDAAIEFATKTLDGKQWRLADQRGKAVALLFWTAADFDTPRTVAMLEDLQKKHPDLRVLGICLDRDPAEIRAAVAELDIDFPVVGDGKGAENDVALRWFVEGPVVHVIDKKGNVAGLGLQAGTNFGRSEFIAVIERALR